MTSSATPEDAVRSVIRALDEQRWSDVPSLIHEESMEQWRPIVEEIVRHHVSQPHDPRFAAEWGVSAFSELNGLPTAELFSRWLAAESPDARRRIAFGPDIHPRAKIEREVLGAVREGDDLAHVVYREAALPGSLPSIARVVTAHRTPGGWKMAPDHHLLTQPRIHVVPTGPGAG